VYALFSSRSSDNKPVGSVRVGTTTVNAIGTSQLPVNTWTHLAVTYDGSSVRVYMNGVLVRTKSQSGTISTSTGVLRIGGNSISAQYFSGVIDEVRIYNRALNQTEIQSDMTAPVSGP
jgi:hypothetical protein